MSLGRRIVLVAIALATLCPTAQAASSAELGTALTDWCTAGQEYQACVDGLKRVQAQMEPAGPSAVKVAMPAPFENALLRREANGKRIASVALTMTLQPGKPRELLVKWLTVHVPNAKPQPVTDNVEGCGTGGIEWRSVAPEVEMQLTGAKSASGADAVISGEGKVLLCFLTPATSGGAASRPVFAASTMRQFIGTIPGLGGGSAKPPTKSDDDLAAQTQRGIELYKAGKYADAVQTLEKAKYGTKGTPELYYWLALAYDKTGKHGATFESTLNESIREKYTPAYLFAGDYWWSRGNKEAAGYYYKTYVEMHGDDPAGVERAQKRSSGTLK